MQGVGAGVLIIILIAFAMYRRMRPQPVQPQRAVVLTVVIVAASALSLVSVQRTSIATHPAALVFAAPALAIGVGGGLLLMRSIHFWRDEGSGALWMKGGVVYLGVWLATVIIRQAVTYASGAYTPGHHAVNLAWAVVADDLVIASMGLWIARAIALVQKYREYERTA